MLQKCVSIYGRREALAQKAVNRAKRKRKQSAIHGYLRRRQAQLIRRLVRRCTQSGWFKRVETQEKETITEDYIEYLLRSIFRSKHIDSSNVGLIDAPIESPASPEEGVRLIRAFICIKQPELRAAIIKLATQVAEFRALTMADQN
jgi:hypothetical protein